MGLFKAKTVNEVDAERDRATARRHTPLCRRRRDPPEDEERLGVCGGVGGFWVG